MVSTALEIQNIQAPSAAFYDSRGNVVTPFLGGISIVRMDGEKVERLGSFVPQRDDGAQYAFQISYSFVDSSDHVVAPISNGHIVVIRTMDEAGNILPVFEKILDVDIVSAAVEALGEDVDTRLLSIVYDYADNLEARYLCADALEQPGYQAESDPWRNAYLTAAQELRQPNGLITNTTTGGSQEVQRKMGV